MEKQGLENEHSGLFCGVFFLFFPFPYSLFGQEEHASPRVGTQAAEL